MERPQVPTARDIMARKLVTLGPDMRASEAAEILLKNGISGAPVVDSDGQLLGLLSEYDCLRAVAAADYEMDAHDVIQTVADLMTTEVHSIPPDMGLYSIAHEFVQRRVRRFPVVEDGHLVGQVSRRDALAAALEIHRKLTRARHDYPDYPAGRAPITNYPRR